MAIQTQTFSQLVSNAVAAVQGAASQLIDLTVGSVLRATVEAFSATVLWLQAIALQVASLTRFATSNGADADSWAADFGFVRLAAAAATGVVTFARFTSTAQATVPVGTIVQTSDGTQKYTVIANTANTAYSAALGAYLLPAGTASITASVQSTSAAASGNVTVGALNTVASAIVGVDTVANAAAFTNGADAETDTAFRTRFVSYIASLSKATRVAIGFALTSIQQGVNYTLTEGLTYAGAPQLGYFYVVVDDGTGTPSGTFLSTVSNAIDAVRPIGSTFGVFAPVVITANVAMTLTTSAGYLHSTVVATVQAAIQAFINALPLGSTLTFSRLTQVAYDASLGVVNVTAVTINGATADIAATSQQVVKVGTNIIT